MSFSFHLYELIEKLVFFFQNEATFSLVRKDYYKAYTQIGESPSDQVQENETTYIAFQTNYLM